MLRMVSHSIGVPVSEERYLNPVEVGLFELTLA